MDAFWVDVGTTFLAELAISGRQNIIFVYFMPVGHFYYTRQINGDIPRENLEALTSAQGYINKGIKLVT